MSQTVKATTIQPAMTPAWEPTSSMEPIKITDVRAICTAPDGIRLVVVKIETSDDGLYGLGCATFTQRPLAVVTAIEEYLRPFLLGRNPDDIEDIWQAAFVSSYWRSGPVLNNGLSGVDMALWDIKGKRAGMPVYDLLGGRSRRAAPMYVHAAARDFQALEDKIRGYLESGFRHFRLDVPVPGRAFGKATSAANDAEELWRPLDLERSVWEPRPYCRHVLNMFEHIRGQLGEEIELLHDVHELLPPIMAVQLAKDLEPYKLFFLEDPVAPEDNDYLRLLRAQSSTPIAMGELYVNQNEYVPVVRDRLIDFMRVHISDIGGLTPARKLATLCEFFGVRTAWHGPSDTSPVGLAANLHLDLNAPNFGIQENIGPSFSERTQKVFPGCPEIRDGAMWSNGKPGFGVDLDEQAAAKYPFPEHVFNGAWPETRRADGTVIRP
ncbi:MAG: mannonate dehydratase [Gaiellaceae bacterium]|jgi:mannonate dehydratase|nr:mannonate dehydratase [Gaiellaceae bacterium]